MKLSRFKVTNYRNIIDSNWIDVASVTAFVGQNEAGKSNLFDALHRLNPYDDADYDIDDDWPADDWKNKKHANGKVVDLPPGRPSFITRVLGVDNCCFGLGQARRARSPQLAQALGALQRVFYFPAMSAA